MGGPREFRIEQDTEEFRGGGGFNNGVIKRYRNNGGIEVSFRKDYKFSFFRGNYQTERKKISREVADARFYYIEAFLKVGRNHVYRAISSAKQR